MDTSSYKIIYSIKGIVFKNNAKDTVLISYKTFAFNYEKSFYHKNKSILTRDLSLPQSPISLAFSGSETVNDGFISDDFYKNNPYPNHPKIPKVPMYPYLIPDENLKIYTKISKESDLKEWFVEQQEDLYECYKYHNYEFECILLLF